MNNEATEEIKRYLDVTVAGLQQEFREHTSAIAEDLRTEFRGARDELGTEIRGVREELRSEIRDVKRHTDVVAESLRADIRLVAEGVAGLDEKFTKEFVNVRTEMREQSDDLKALIRASYADLDGRIPKHS